MADAPHSAFASRFVSSLRLRDRRVQKRFSNFFFCLHSWDLNLSRPREIRERTVPMGTFKIAAISL